MSNRHPSRAFTLLELLIVVAVIALLLAVLLPALGRAREEGRSAQCAATLHNAGLAMTLYLNDNRGIFWPYFTDIGGQGGGRKWWFGFERGGPSHRPSQPHRRLDKTAGYLGAYLTGTAQDFRCPSFPYLSGNYFPKFSPSAGGYGYNTATLGGFNQYNPIERRPRSIQTLGSRAADVFVLADGIHFDRLDYSSRPPLEQTFNEPAYIQWQDPALYDSNVGVNGGYGHFRHNGRANVLYADGHVASQPPRRRLHPYSRRGLGPIANLSDESLRVREIHRGNRILSVDAIYGIEK